MSDDAAGGDRDEVAADRLLDGRLILHQFRKGHRAGTDAVLLAAAADIGPGDSFIDVGAGAGAVGLALALREPACTGVLLDNDAAVVSLAEQNIAANSLERQASAICADLFDRETLRHSGLSGSLVVTNPPFYLPGSVRESAVRTRAAAHVLGAAVHAAWVAGCRNLLQPKGRLVMIHRPDALPDLLTALAEGLGDIVLRPVHARATSPAIRVLIGARAGSRAPLTVRPALVLHEDDGAFTGEAADVHRGAASSLWPNENRPRRAGSIGRQ